VAGQCAVNLQITFHFADAGASQDARIPDTSAAHPIELSQQHEQLRGGGAAIIYWPKRIRLFEHERSQTVKSQSKHTFGFGFCTACRESGRGGKAWLQRGGKLAATGILGHRTPEVRIVNALLNLFYILKLAGISGRQ
jgi:hypothetical protein